MSKSLGAVSDLSEDLIQKIQAGDRDAWKGFLERYRDEMLFAVRARLGPGLRAHLESEDILQSVLLEAIGEVNAFERRAPGSLGGFIATLIGRKIKDRADTFAAQKRRGTIPLGEEADRLAAPGVGYKDPERYERIESLLERLPDEMRTIVVLRKIDGLSSRDSATALGITDDAARKLYSRAMARLAALAADKERP